jgi:glyoxylase-like metal-dependent hydrolase (beta-lactamase superfamily II)
MVQQVGVPATAQVGVEGEHGIVEVAADLAIKRLMIVNVVLVGPAGARDREWVLIDAGLPGTASTITAAATSRFGPDSRPGAIVMTHGHFDHFGALEKLVEQWDVPVYAHPDEHPYLNGQASYPPPDPAIGGGLMTQLSPLYPRGPVDVSRHLHELPPDGSLPLMQGWQWLHTPGHSVGHCSFWREADRALIAGDAVITTAQESAYAVAVQAAELHGPPMYYTQDWPAAKRSVETLAHLGPMLLITGHGHPMQGEDMQRALHVLADQFDEVAHPPHAKYLDHPVSAADGSAYFTRSDAKG